MAQSQANVVQMLGAREIVYYRVTRPSGEMLAARLAVTPIMRQEDDRLIDVLHAMGFLTRTDYIVVDMGDEAGVLEIVPMNRGNPDLILKSV